MQENVISKKKNFLELVYIEFIELLMARYATKRFDGQKIEVNTVDKILEMIRFSPSAGNIQPWKVKVVIDEDTKKKLSAASFDQPQIITCSHLLVFCADKDLAGNTDKLINLMKDSGMPEENLKLFIEAKKNIVTKYSNDNEYIYEAKYNVFIAAATALYAAKSVGVDSCPMQAFDPAAY